MPVRRWFWKAKGRLCGVPISSLSVPTGIPAGKINPRSALPPDEDLRIAVEGIIAICIALLLCGSDFLPSAHLFASPAPGSAR